MRKGFLREILDEVAQGRDLVSLFMAPGRSPLQVWRALKLLASMEGSPLYRKVASRYRVDPSYLLHRVQGLIQQLEGLREEDPYTLLGVGYTASPAEIHQRWKALMREWHPDKRRGEAGALERCRRINEAYELLKDRERRREYDRRYVPLLALLKEVEEEGESLPHPGKGPVGRRVLFSLLGGLLVLLALIWFFSSGGERGSSSVQAPQAPRVRVEAPPPQKVAGKGKEQPFFLLGEGLLKKRRPPSLEVPPLQVSALTPQGTGLLSSAPSVSKGKAKRGRPRKMKEKAGSREKGKPQPRRVALHETGGDGGVKPRPASKEMPPKKGTQKEVSPSRVVAVERKREAPSQGSAPVPSREAPGPLSVVNRFIQAYEGGDLPRLLSLFSRDARENGEPLSSYIPRYRQFFGAFRVLDYKLMDERVTSRGEKAQVEGNYLVSLVARSGGNIHWIKGRVVWTLVREGDGWVIESLDYTME